MALGNSLTTVAGLEPSVGRVVIEDTNHPVNTRFLHVLQGADSNAIPDVVAYVVSSAGNAFEGAAVRGAVVMFPVNAISNNFTSVTYSVLSGITNHYIAGLTPGSSYTVSQNLIGNMRQVTVAPRRGSLADSAGLLSVNLAGQTSSGPLQFVSAVWVGSSLQLNGTGTANLIYRILSSTNLASTNWVAVGSATADSNGNFQFIDPGASSYPQRFYRASWP